MSVAATSGMGKQQDPLDKTIAFLQKREGIDKTLKIVRYTSRLIAAVSPPGSEQKQRFEALQSSVGTSRKAYRLGKFLQDVNSVRKMKAWTNSSLALLELVAYAGEGTYYFLDQFLWLMKAGFIPKDHESRVSRVSAWSEVVGYAANIALSLNEYQALLQQEQALARKIHSCKRDSTDGNILNSSLTAQLSLVRSARLLRLALIIQDLADSMTAINDITEGRYRGINHPVLLACAGLVSAAVSSYKYWGT